MRPSREYGAHQFGYMDPSVRALGGSYYHQGKSGPSVCGGGHHIESGHLGIEHSGNVEAHILDSVRCVSLAGGDVIDRAVFHQHDEPESCSRRHNDSDSRPCPYSSRTLTLRAHVCQNNFPMRPPNRLVGTSPLNCS